jgi:hypothetical protein
MRVFALSTFVIFVCLSVIFGVFIAVRFVLFILPYSMFSFPVVVDVLRVVLAVALAYLWLRVWKMITDRYFWRSIRLAKCLDDA